jgi:hypothetical protein
MTKKQTKQVVSSGVDISDLSQEQLNVLANEVKIKSLEFEETAKKARLEKLEESGDLPSLREEFENLKKEFKELNSQVTFTLMVPIRFTLETNSIHDDLITNLDENGFDDINAQAFLEAFDVFSHSITAEVTKGSPLSKTQRNALNYTLCECIEDSSLNDILDIVPTEIKKNFSDFAKTLNKFFKKARKVGANFSDFVK